MTTQSSSKKAFIPKKASIWESGRQSTHPCLCKPVTLSHTTQTSQLRKQKTSQCSLQQPLRPFLFAFRLLLLWTCICHTVGSWLYMITWVLPLPLVPGVCTWHLISTFSKGLQLWLAPWLFTFFPQFPSLPHRLFGCIISLRLHSPYITQSLRREVGIARVRSQDFQVEAEPRYPEKSI